MYRKISASILPVALHKSARGAFRRPLLYELHDLCFSFIACWSSSVYPQMLGHFSYCKVHTFICHTVTCNTFFSKISLSYHRPTRSLSLKVASFYAFAHEKHTPTNVCCIFDEECGG